MKGCTVCKSTNVFANHLRFIVIVLELNPLRFVRKLAQLVY